eukprot:TRINITY_DN8226_c1_g1_i6.p1 TRINITY_DN8226_c1_g1~~TRINITY_DN8226_c1_g1_i6.p1  ORF type:complete len:104 (-),score=5.51 TRINITY_DN8226_c1_g1_i6:79-390(-)
MLGLLVSAGFLLFLYCIYLFTWFGKLYGTKRWPLSALHIGSEEAQHVKMLPMCLLCCFVSCCLSTYIFLMMTYCGQHFGTFTTKIMQVIFHFEKQESQSLCLL